MVAKSKSKPNKLKFNPIIYLKTGSARKLPVYECLLPDGWEEIKKFPVIFSRKHVNGNITFVSVLVDLLCTGAKDVLFFVNEPESLYRDILDSYTDGLLMEFEPVSYELIHNVIFESVAFAEEYGIAPHEDFRYAEWILEEDSDDFPRIEIPLGENGKAHLYLNEEDERSQYFERQIRKYGEPGTYEITRNDFDPYLNENEDAVEDDFDEEEWEDADLEDAYFNSCFSWDELDWENFFRERNFDELTSDVIIFTLLRLQEYSYEEMLEEPDFASYKDIRHTIEAVTENLFTKEEIKYLEKVYLNLEESNLEFEGTDQELLGMIEKGIAKYPNNRIIHQYKWEYYQRSSELPKALEIALDMKEKFPDYLFGLTCHAQTLIEMGEVDSIPAAMNNFTKIQDFLPDRKEFHITELQSFYSPWIYYYSKTGQLKTAAFLFNFLDDHLVLLAHPLHELVENAFANAASKEVKSYYEKVKVGKVSQEEFLKMILGN